MSHRAELEALEARIRALLPEDYQDTYEQVQPTAMGSAGLRFDSDGKVAWDEMWGSFCDLAMAGGPPHKGALLEPGDPALVDAEPDRYRTVVDEIRRGVTIVAGLMGRASPTPGWVRVTCLDEWMAGWLLRAITMENVAVRAEGPSIDVPAAPHFRLEKEIKNVITVVAKTCHYWMGHTSRAQQRAIGRLLATMTAEAPLLEPGAATRLDLSAETSQRRLDRMVAAIHHGTGLLASAPRYANWFGVEYPTVRSAIWMMRAMTAGNVLARREGTAVLVPINPEQDPGGDRVVDVLIRTHRLAGLKGIV
jgi:hypothetical protein